MNKICFHIIFLGFTLFWFHKGTAQNPIEKDSEIFANATDAEKIYLQLSGTTFNTSEIIWFKAIITNVLDHTPTKKSGVVHVEFIDPLNNQIVDRNLLKINNGIANGFFQLHPNYREGKYMLRAYTEWNKNFGADFINSIPINLFRSQKNSDKPNPIQNIVLTKNFNSNSVELSSSIILNELDSLYTGNVMLYMNWDKGKDSLLIKQKRKQSKVKVQHSIPKNTPVLNYRLQAGNDIFTKSIAIDTGYSSLQFFPEGGSLVEGIQSVVGFKYLNYKGKGSEIQGYIEDENNNKITEFKSNALGMGKIVLNPSANKSYYGVLNSKNGNSSRYKLPKAKKNGQVLGIIGENSEKILRIWNKDNNKDSLFIKFFHRGKNLFALKARFRNGMFSYKIESKDMPHGVIGLTIFDKYYKPVAERHFFNNLKNENLEITVGTNKERYVVRDSIQVNISTQYKDKPIPASLSIMAVDSSYYQSTNLDRSHIVSYFLLQSDIKGKIENPSYYFTNEKNLAELDYLMLTQGWTNYKYKEEKKPNLIFPQKGLEIKGMVHENKKISKTGKSENNNYKLDMLILGETFKAITLKTDSTGHFKFDFGDNYGSSRKFIIQASEDSNKNSKLKINIEKYDIPEIAYNIENMITPVNSIIEKKITQKIEEDIDLDPFLFTNDITLDEVVVSDYKITPLRSKMLELHGMPDLVIDNQELLNKRKNWTQNLYRWLLFNYPSSIRVQRVGNKPGFEIAYVNGAEWTYVVVDGIPVQENEYNLIETIPVSAVKSVEILRNTATANKYFNDVFNCAPTCPPPAFPAILAIYTYSGKGLFGAFRKPKNTGLIVDRAPQYTPTREFYTPEYPDRSKIDWNIPDRRTLLYWEPNLKTNKEGRAKASFYNADLTGKMLIICEGITANGKVGYTEFFYDVDNP